MDYPELVCHAQENLAWLRGNMNIFLELTISGLNLKVYVGMQNRNRHRRRDQIVGCQEGEVSRERWTGSLQFVDANYDPEDG